MTHFAPHGSPATTVHAVAADDLAALLDGLGSAAKRWAEASGYAEAKRGTLLVPGEGDAVVDAVIHIAELADPFWPAALRPALPAGDYALAEPLANEETGLLAWALAAYRFERYREASAPPATRLVLPASADAERLQRLADGVFVARDLINTPANDMGPDELEAHARALARSHSATVAVVKGEALEGGFPMIHAVGRASPRAPRLIDLTWGAEDAPKVTLVGKGVVFDTGGLDIKPATAMRNMKKDMGGAANAIALAQMIMDAGLPVRLRLLVPAVENAIDGSAFRPGDVLRSRKGLSVEIGNTDAEGRLVLADALDLACEEEPDLLIDLATLTGAARVALGPEVMPFYTDDEALGADLSRHAAAVHDPLWPMPLWAGYEPWLASKVADVSHISSQPFAGSVTAALFLKRFVDGAKAWVHFDIFGWNATARPGRPEGGEAQGIRALYGLIEERYGRANP